MNKHQQVPEEFVCPITAQVMNDPVIVDDGHTFQRQAILQWFAQGHSTNPVTNLKLKNLQLRPNYALLSLITKFKEKNTKSKIEKNENMKEKIPKMVQNLIKSKREKKVSQPQWIQRINQNQQGPWNFEAQGAINSNPNGWQNWGNERNNGWGGNGSSNVNGWGGNGWGGSGW